jgi:hypothetical protein
MGNGGASRRGQKRGINFTGPTDNGWAGGGAWKWWVGGLLENGEQMEMGRGEGRHIIGFVFLSLNKMCSMGMGVVVPSWWVEGEWMGWMDGHWANAWGI